MVFLFEPATIPAKMTMVDNFLKNQILMLSLNLQKKNPIEKKMGDDFIVTGQGVPKMSPLSSFKKVIKILLRGRDLIIDHGNIF